jgi:hypothetical protein
MIGSTFQSYLFAQAFGLYFVIMAVMLLSRENYYRNKLTQEPSYPSFLSCSLALFISILLVLLHNVWVFQPRVAVTIVCWLFLIRSVLWLSMPERMFELTKKVCLGKRYYVLIILMMLVGIAMMVRGSYLYVMIITGS